MQYRIAMQVSNHVWRVTRCWQGKGKPALVHDTAEGKELVMSCPFPHDIGDTVCPRGILWLWLNRPRRVKARFETERARVAHALFDVFVGDSYA